MALDTKSVHSMLAGIERYNPKHIAVLETYVQQQVATGTYDFEANLALLKLYQFNPKQFNVAVVTNILLKALANLPTTDFIMSLFLIPESYHEDEQIGRVMHLSQLLETAHFRDFWAEIADTPELVEHVAGFPNSIRKYIGYILSITYQSIGKNLLSGLLNLEGEALDKFIAGIEAWKVETDANSNKPFVSLGLNRDNQSKAKSQVESIDFTALTRVLASSAI